MASRISSERFRPEQFKLTSLAAMRLGKLAGVEPKELTGLTVSEISDRYRHVIDPRLLFFRRVCGKVVKKDPVSGVEYPVPYATVLVEDTDCSLLGYFPKGSKWSWYFPFKCHREVIATVKTNDCGEFCAWVPRWDIDWVLHFRKERLCYPVIFERPSLRDLLQELIPEKIPDPRPGPDPAPFVTVDRGRFIKLVEDTLGRDNALSLDRVQSQSTLGANTLALNEAFDGHAMMTSLVPPLPEALRLNTPLAARATDSSDVQRNTLAAMLNLDAQALGKLDLRAHIGPFKRCHDVYVPVWTPLIDIPDITFRVTQDTNGDGIEEEIYAEGYFQVRWNATQLPAVKLLAKPNARAGLPCHGDTVPCSNAPAIVLAGRMPVVNEPTIYDPVNGYALRPNRPHVSGLFDDALPKPAAAAPFHGAVALLGCKNNIDPAATHYRVVYKYSHDKGATFTDPTPFVGLTWPLFRLNAGLPQWHYPVADANGWYPINLPAGPAWLPSENLLLDWPTSEFADGRYVLQLELGTPTSVTSRSAEVAFNIDNSLPLGPLTVEWRKAGVGAFQPLNYPCPLVRRGAVPVDLEFRVTMTASASHLRSAILTPVDCGGGHFTYVSGTSEHWHNSTSDNAEVLQAIYRLPSGALQGTYGFSGEVSGRAFNPSGADAGHLKPVPWEYDPDDRHIYPSFAFSIIDVD